MMALMTRGVFVILLFRDLGVHEGSRVQVVLQDQKETTVCQDLRVHKETKVPKVHQGPWVSADHQDHL